MNKPFYILCDVNCNLLNSSDPASQALVNFCTSFNLTQLIREPKKVTESTKTFIEVILVSHKNLRINAKVMPTCTSVSDHDLIYTILKLKRWRPRLVYVISSSAELATQINGFFTSTTQEFEPLMQAQTPPNIVSPDLLVSLEEDSSDLHRWNIGPDGPDGISNKLLKQFAPKLAPLIQGIYNQSLREGFVPDTLKWSIISPVPKVCPPQHIKGLVRN